MVIPRFSSSIVNLEANSSNFTRSPRLIPAFNSCREARKRTPEIRGSGPGPGATRSPGLQYHLWRSDGAKKLEQPGYDDFLSSKLIKPINGWDFFPEIGGARSQDIPSKIGR